MKHVFSAGLHAAILPTLSLLIAFSGSACINFRDISGDKAIYSNPQAGKFVAVSPGMVASCALLEDGSPVCWGGTDEDLLRPPPGRYKQIHIGGFCICGVTDEGAALCWGNPNIDCGKPEGTFLAVNAGRGINCGLRTDHTVLCWGNSSLVLAARTSKIIDFAVGSEHVCALAENGKADCFGRDAPGCMTPPDELFTQISMSSFGDGDTVACGITREGKAVCWGYDRYGEAQTAPKGEPEILAFSADTFAKEQQAANRMNESLKTVNKEIERQTAMGSVLKQGTWQANAAIGAVGIATVLRNSDFHYNRLKKAVIESKLTSPPPGVYKQVTVGTGSIFALTTEGYVVCWGACTEDKPPSWAFSRIEAGWGYGCGIVPDGRISCWGADMFDRAKLP